MRKSLGKKTDAAAFRGIRYSDPLQVPPDSDVRLISAVLDLDRREWSDPGESLKVSIEVSETKDGPWQSMAAFTWFAPIPSDEASGTLHCNGGVAGLWVRAALTGKTFAGVEFFIE